MYEVLDPNLLPEGRSIWIIDMKGQSHCLHTIPSCT